MQDLTKLYWRIGVSDNRLSQRTIFASLKFGEANHDDPRLGVMDTKELAERVIHAHNCLLTGAEIGEE